MALLDVKELNYFKYVLGNIIVPFGVFVMLIARLGCYMEGSVLVVCLAEIGVAVVCCVLFKMARWLYYRVSRVPRDVRSYGKWAVVTGATSGIGESFCHELAQRGMSILLISRSEVKLKDVAHQITTNHKGVSTRHLMRDFSDMSDDATSSFADKLNSTLTELHSDGGIGMLVNCVGVVNALPTLLHQLDAEEVRQILCVNNDGTVAMSRAVLPFMMSHKSGAVITVSSGSCRHATPLVSLYSATKSFGYQLTRSLHYEYKEHGIDCLAITPYYFISNLYKRSKPTFMAPRPASIVNSSLRLLGYQAESFGWWAHALGCLFATNFTINDPADRMLVSMKQNRDRALTKQCNNVAADSKKTS